jgi:hypothetical protein
MWKHRKEQRCRQVGEQATSYTLYGKKPAGQVKVGDDPRKEILLCASAKLATYGPQSALKEQETPVLVYINGNSSTGGSGTKSANFQLPVGTNGKVWIRDLTESRFTNWS